MRNSTIGLIVLAASTGYLIPTMVFGPFTAREIVCAMVGQAGLTVWQFWKERRKGDGL